MKLTYSLRSLLLIGFFTVIGFSSSAIAQLQNCDGVWSNKPCDKVSTDKVSQYKSSQDIQEVPREGRASADTDPNLSKKQGLIHQLFKESSEARRKFGIQTDLSVARAICFDKSADLEVCNRTVSEVSDRLHDRMHQAEELALKKKELELKEKNQHQQDTTTNINVNNSTQIYSVRRPHDRREIPVERPSSGVSVEIKAE